MYVAYMAYTVLALYVCGITSQGVQCFVYLSLHSKPARAELALAWHMCALQCLFMMILPVSCLYTVMLLHSLRLMLFAYALMHFALSHASFALGPGAVPRCLVVAACFCRLPIHFGSVTPL